MYEDNKTLIVSLLSQNVQQLNKLLLKNRTNNTKNVQKKKNCCQDFLLKNAVPGAMIRQVNFDPYIKQKRRIIFLLWKHI